MKAARDEEFVSLLGKKKIVLPAQSVCLFERTRYMCVYIYIVNFSQKVLEEEVFERHVISLAKRKKKKRKKEDQVYIQST